MLDIQQIVVSWAFHPKWTGKSGLPVMAPILLAFCSGMLGCGSPSESGPILLGELPILTAVEDLRIGSLDDPDLGFSRISGVHVDRDGQLFVGESLLQEIRVFDLDGNFVRIIGGKGEGPGEFQYLFRWGVVGDTVWVADYQLQRTTLFDRAGRLLSAAFWAGVPVMYGTSGSSGLLSPFTMRTDGLFTGEMAVFALAVGSSRSQDSLRVPEVLFDAQGNVVDTVGWDVRPPTGPSSAERVQVGSRRYTVPQPPSDAALELEYSAGRWVVERTRASSDTLSILNVVHVNWAGDTLAAQNYMYLPRVYPEEVLDSIAMQRVSGRAQPGETDAAWRAVREALDFPDFQSPVLEGVTGSDGTLWLRREDRGGPTFRWLVIGPDGGAQGHVDVSRQSRVRWVGQGEL